MKKLDENVAYYLGDLSEEQREELRQKLLKAELESARYWNALDSNYIIYDDEWLKVYYVEDYVNALTLFEEEWKPTQGEKVLWSDDEINFSEGFFVCSYNDNFIVDDDGCLFWAIIVEPIEDKIKVGDWVMRDCKIFKATEDTNSSFCVKITNQQLIELLEQEIK